MKNLQNFTGENMSNNYVCKVGKLELYVEGGDVTQTPSDAIMTAINSGGMWFGGIDGAIQRVAGNQYHAQAGMAELEDGNAIVATGDRNSHRGQFDNVIFVVDDLRKPLNEIVYAGLEAAHNSGYESIAMPTIRMGLMAGVVESTPQEAVQRIGAGVETFMATYATGTSLRKLSIVTFRDPSSNELLKRVLSRN